MTERRITLVLFGAGVAIVRLLGRPSFGHVSPIGVEAGRVLAPRRDSGIRPDVQWPGVLTRRQAIGRR